MRLLYGEDGAVAHWVAAQIPHVDSFEKYAAIGVVTDRLIAGMVFYDYQPQCRLMQISVAAVSPHWVRLAGDILAYPFYQENVYKIWTTPYLENRGACRITEFIGGTKEGVLAHHYGPGKHAVAYRMTKPEYERKYAGNVKSAA